MVLPCCAIAGIDSKATETRKKNLIIITIPYSYFLVNILYTAGNTNKVRSVEVTNPPITTVASGRCTSAPSPCDSAIGKKPIEATRAVMSTGRNLVLQLSTMRWCMSATPLRCSRFICPMSTMPLSTATPNRAMKPTPADMENGIPLSHNAHTPPMAASGMAENTKSDSRTFRTVA